MKPKQVQLTGKDAARLIMQCRLPIDGTAYEITLKGIAQLAEEAGTVPFPLDQRRLAEVTGQCLKLVSRHLKVFLGELIPYQPKSSTPVLQCVRRGSAERGPGLYVFHPDLFQNRDFEGRWDPQRTPYKRNVKTYSLNALLSFQSLGSLQVPALLLRALEHDLAIRLRLQSGFNPSVLTYRVPPPTHPIPSGARHLLWDRFESPLAYLLWCSVTEHLDGTRLDDRQARRLAARFTTLGLFESVGPRVWRRCALATREFDRIARTMPDRKTSIKARLMTARRKKAAKAPLKKRAARIVELNVFRDLPESIRKARLKRVPDQKLKADGLLLTAPLIAREQALTAPRDRGPEHIEPPVSEAEERMEDIRYAQSQAKFDRAWRANRDQEPETPEVVEEDPGVAAARRLGVIP